MMEATKRKSMVPMMIVATFLLFGIFIGSMVYRAGQLDINLVRDDYYQQTLLLDAHMADVARTAAENIDLTFSETSKTVMFKVPDHLTDDIAGSLHFYRPSNAELDFTVPIQLQNGEQKLSAVELQKGKWNVKVTFTSHQKNYYKETFFIL